MDITDLIRQRLVSKGVINVIIAGGTCSGKTTLADNLQNKFKEEFAVSHIKQDDYFKDLADIPKTRQGYLTDSINAFHTQEFVQDVKILLSSGKVLIPRYEVSKNIRLAKDRCIMLGQVNIFEGLHTITLLSGLENSLRVFLDTPLDICLKRRITRDTSAYGVSEERINENFSSCILPMYRSYIAPQKEQAEIIIEGVGFN
jgi:uridine kinase